jgi:AcrR family transcriptional regulator
MTMKRKTGRPIKIPGQQDTAEKIFETSIDLFAQNGYDSVSIRDIASAVGIKESSIYKHYTNKEAILQKIIKYPLTKIYSVAQRNDTTEQLIAKEGVDGFLADCANVFASWMTDEKTVKILRIFYIEVYHNDQIAQSYRELISTGNAFWASVMDIMMTQGLIKQGDAKVVSAIFMAFFWNAFTDYFLLQYGRTSKSFVDLYWGDLSRHTNYFITVNKVIKNEQ